MGLEMLFINWVNYMDGNFKGKGVFANISMSCKIKYVLRMLFYLIVSIRDSVKAMKYLICIIWLYYSI